MRAVWTFVFVIATLLAVAVVGWVCLVNSDLFTGTVLADQPENPSPAGNGLFPLVSQPAQEVERIAPRSAGRSAVPVSPSPLNGPFSSKPVPPSTAAGPLPPFASELGRLKKEYQDLARQHGELLDEATLTAEITQLKQKINSLRAAEKVKSARAILQQVVEQHPDSPAARLAKRMLENEQAADKSGEGEGDLFDGEE